MTLLCLCRVATTSEACEGRREQSSQARLPARAALPLAATEWAKRAESRTEEGGQNRRNAADDVYLRRLRLLRLDHAHPLADQPVMLDPPMLPKRERLRLALLTRVEVNVRDD